MISGAEEMKTLDLCVTLGRLANLLSPLLFVSCKMGSKYNDTYPLGHLWWLQELMPL